MKVSGNGFLKIEEKLDTAVESTIRMEGKVDALSKDHNDSDAVQKSHELRIATLEQENAQLKGSLRTLHWLGGLLVGAAIIGATIVMLVK